MKKLMLIAFVFAGMSLSAQNASFGLKGGLNFGATGEYESVGDATGDFTSSFEDGENKTGFHAGLFAQFELLGIFIQPELMYTQLNTEYSTFDYTLNKIDAPVLLGVNILGPLNIKAGPSFQYILDNKADGAGIEIEEVENDITVGYQLGAGINLGRLAFDLRYEGAFSENTAFGLNETAAEEFTLDSRPSQWILSVAYAL
ncbi:outer membrane beta-barrel protein [Christiangramia aestuarii]|uniref:PorT family protein n=1 Tax=Christiangramia aestuarii TaxID=1028746 RepID=A0A7M3SYS1_9FLAO|nr:outer membrane beta-barrel protein [Christiangramia aestuarii]MUP41752.1 PorT family protein [Christiangramia aestuarii]